MVEDVSQLQAEKLERKRLKKLKKKQAALAEASQPSDATAPAEIPNGSLPARSDEADGEAKPRKKKKRKQQLDSTSLNTQTEPEAQKSRKKKNKQSQDGAVADTTTGEDASDGLQMPKQNAGSSTSVSQLATASEERLKSKRQKSKPDGAGAKAATVAAVGDHELAKSGTPVQKALYTENSVVSRMTDAAVQQWRDERQIVVTGCDIRPVTAFDQAGDRSRYVQLSNLYVGELVHTIALLSTQILMHQSKCRCRFSQHQEITNVVCSC